MIRYSNESLQARWKEGIPLGDGFLQSLEGSDFSKGRDFQKPVFSRFYSVLMGFIPHNILSPGTDCLSTVSDLLVPSVLKRPNWSWLSNGATEHQLLSHKLSEFVSDRAKGKKTWTLFGTHKTNYINFSGRTLEHKDVYTKYVDPAGNFEPIRTLHWFRQRIPAKNLSRPTLLPFRRLPKRCQLHSICM